MTFHYIPLASALHDAQALSALLKDYEEALIRLGGSRLDALLPDPPDAVFYFVETGGVEGQAMRRFHSRVQRGNRTPVFLIAHPGHNALPAALEILAQVRQEGGTGRIFLMRGADDRDTLAAIAGLARCIEANRRLSQDRIGRIGPSSDWLVASSHRADVVKSRFGVDVVDLEMAELEDYIQTEPLPEDGPEFDILKQGGAGGPMARDEFAHAIRVYRGLKKMVAANRLTALTLRCFDLLSARKTTGCLALALLSDAGITSGCEGDIPSILLLRWLRHLTGREGWMANPADMDAQTGEMVLAHCTIPFKAITSYHLRTHFESGLGVAIAGTLPQGPVSIMRLGGATLEKAWWAEGELEENLSMEHLCRTQVRVRVSPSDIHTLLSAPLGNHVVLIPERIGALFSQAFSLFETP